MMKLDNFINMMTGHFNNKEQFDNMQREGKTYPYAEHIFSLLQRKKTELCCILMKYQKEKIKVRFHMIL